MRFADTNLQKKFLGQKMTPLIQRIGRVRTALLGCALLLCATCTNNTEPPRSVQNRVLTAPTGASVAMEPEDGQWTMPAKNYASTRFSGLEDINAGNVSNLKLAWSFSTGVLRGHEAAPIVANNTMYVITPYPNIVYALDLTQPGVPVKWKYEPQPAASAQGVACCDFVNRGVFYADGRIFSNTLDNHTIALDANTGQEIWKTKVGEINMGESMTMAPLVSTPGLRCRLCIRRVATTKSARTFRRRCASRLYSRRRYASTLFIPRLRVVFSTASQYLPTRKLWYKLPTPRLIDY